jgi:hypothetical protein
MPAPDRGWLIALLRDLGFPTVRVARGVVIQRDAAGWAATPLQPGERLTVLRGLTLPVLAATDGGRQRLARWRQQRPERRASPIETMPERRRRLRESLVHVGGDEALLSIAVDVFAGLPTPIAASLADDVAICGVGLSTRGWSCGAGLHGPDGRRPCRMIAVCGASGDPVEIAATFRHELAHAWFRPPPEPGAPPAQAQLTVGREQMFTLARVEGWEHEAHARVARRAPTGRGV